MNSTLFTVSCTWQSSVWLYEQLAFASRGDAILLLQDAVLALQSETSLASFVAKCDSHGVHVYALKEDSAMRGTTNCHPTVDQINYSEFVDLVIQYKKQVAW